METPEAFIRSGKFYQLRIRGSESTGSRGISSWPRRQINQCFGNEDCRRSEGGDACADPHAVQAAARRPGKQIVITLQDATGNLHAVWRVIGRDGTNYLRQELTLQAARSAVPLRQTFLLELPLLFPYTTGSVSGSPIVAGNVFCGVEHPMADNEVNDTGTSARSNEQWTSSPGKSPPCRQ